MDNITLKNGQPEWSIKCQDCMSCIHNCQKDFINIKKTPQNRGKYINPKISVEEIVLANN